MKETWLSVKVQNATDVVCYFVGPRSASHTKLDHQNTGCHNWYVRCELRFRPAIFFFNFLFLDKQSNKLQTPPQSQWLENKNIVPQRYQIKQRLLQRAHLAFSRNYLPYNGKTGAFEVSLISAFKHTTSYAGSTLSRQRRRGVWWTSGGVIAFSMIEWLHQFLQSLQFDLIPHLLQHI